MLFELALTLTVSSVLLEFLVVTKYAFILELLSRNALAGLAFSLLLSAAIGELFGATGLVVLIAGAASTVVMALVYRTGLLVAIEPLLVPFLR
jgi:hypothetical protein